MTQRHELWQLADQLQMDLRSASAKLVELRSQLARLDLPDQERYVCPDVVCRLTFRSTTKLAEHRYYSHDGPFPDHWTTAESRAEELT